MDRNQEMAVKVERVRAVMRQAELEGIVLRQRANFAWLTGGGLSYVSTQGDAGVAAMLVTGDRVVLIANNIEARRLMEEELAGLDVGVAEFPWHDAAAEDKVIADIVGSSTWGCDVGEGCQVHAESIKAARNPLTEPEIARYRAHGRLTTELTERVCRLIKPGMTEHDVWALAHEAFGRIGVRVPVCLVAADERIDTRRHPITVGAPIRERFMLVVCAESGGLWTNLTRLVNFVPIGDELKARHRACCQVDAAANAATRPGRTLGDVFGDIVAEYERQGFAGEWQRHHQGGSTGYDGRDCFAVPGCDAPIGVDQAFAWNPSITGTKSEDTMLLREQGVEFLTAPGDDWPAIGIECEGQTMRRADILFVGA